VTDMPKALPSSEAADDRERALFDEHDPSTVFTEPADVIVRLKRERTRMVSVRVDEGLVEELKAVASAHGLPYQKLMRELLRQSLANLARREGRSARA